jgi:hypothetical protein
MLKYKKVNNLFFKNKLLLLFIIFIFSLQYKNNNNYTIFMIKIISFVDSFKHYDEPIKEFQKRL